MNEAKEEIAKQISKLDAKLDKYSKSLASFIDGQAKEHAFGMIGVYDAGVIKRFSENMYSDMLLVVSRRNELLNLLKKLEADK